MDLDVRTLDDLDLDGKRVLCRVDFNVPLEERDGVVRITDDTRIRAALPTIREILARGGRPVLLSHLGRPKGVVVEGLRLTPVGRRLQELLGTPVQKLDESTGPAVERAIAAAPAGTVVLRENVRFHPGETKGEAALAAAFARLGDVFVGDAFGAAHRDHASVCGVARLLPAAAGRLVERELAAFRRVLERPEEPVVAVLGGAKVSDKLPVIDHLVERVSALCIGGGMAYTFLKSQGTVVGRSLVEEGRLESSHAALVKARRIGVDVLLPVDHVAARELAPDAEPVVTGIEIPDDLMGLDIGPRTRALFAERIRGARTVVWNGPMGVFEIEAFRAGTQAVAEAVAACPGYTVVGGGDSVAAVELLGLAGRIDHISTGGGASLELLEGRTLPGVAVLARSRA
jgi:phosphoglycerate kinase